MHTEIELKLSTDPTTLQAIYQESFLKHNKWQDKLLCNSYFDDRNFTLKAWQMALRIRDDGTHKIQTLKINHTNCDGLSKRSEFDVILPLNSANKLNLEPIYEYLPPNLGELKVIFITNFRRLSCQINYGNSHIELALDCGSAQAGSQFAPICELELELIKGNVEDVQALSTKLQSKFKLQLSNISKAKLGFNLLKC